LTLFESGGIITKESNKRQVRRITKDLVYILYHRNQALEMRVETKAVKAHKKEVRRKPNPVSPELTKMNEIKNLTKKILNFRDARDWKQFHNPKDVALSMVLEAAELMEHFQWKSKEEAEAYILTHKKK